MRRGSQSLSQILNLFNCAKYFLTSTKLRRVIPSRAYAGHKQNIVLRITDLFLNKYSLQQRHWPHRYISSMSKNCGCSFIVIEMLWSSLIHFSFGSRFSCVEENECLHDLQNKRHEATWWKKESSCTHFLCLYYSTF